MKKYKIKRLKAKLIEVEARIKYREQQTGDFPATWLNEAARLAGEIARLEAK